MTDNEEFKVNDKRGSEKTTEVSSSNQEEAQTDDTPKVDPQNLPEANFMHFAASLGTSSLMHMGLMENPHTKSKELDLTMAKHEIDLLSMLEEKTKGNLNDQEKEFLTQLLYELRMHFVQVSKDQ